MILEKYGHAMEAMKCYVKAIELNPQYAEAYNSKGT